MKKALVWVLDRIIVVIFAEINAFVCDALKNHQGGLLFFALFSLAMYLMDNMAMLKLLYSYLAIAGAIALALKVMFPFSSIFAVPEPRRSNRRRVVR